MAGFTGFRQNVEAAVRVPEGRSECSRSASPPKADAATGSGPRSSIANVAPRLSHALHDLASARTPEADAKLTQLMRTLVTPLYAYRGRKKGYEVSVMKTMMDLTGQVGGQVRPPLNDLTPAEVKEWRTLLKPWRKWL